MRDGYDILDRGDSFSLCVWGSTKEELCARALLGLAAILRPDVPISGGTAALYVRVHEQNFSDALEKFLARVIFESEMHNAIFSGMHIIRMEKGAIEAELMGVSVNHFEEEVHEIELGHLDCVEGRWEAEFSAVSL